MDLITNLSLGFQTALSADALLFCLLGVTVGTFVGVLPGFGPLAALSILLPLTFQLEPTVALITLAGIYYGAQYGGSTAAILLNLPGTAPSAVTCLDGYPMTKQGRAGVALLMATISSFVGGSLAILLVMSFAPPLAQFALRFGAAEYFSVMLLGLIAASTLSVGSPLKGLVTVAVGVSLGLVGMDINSGAFRYTFGFLGLTEGLSLVAVAMGLFGVSEILANSGHDNAVTIRPRSISFRSMIPTREDMRRSWKSTLRGSLIGSVVGILPGAGATIASFLAYATEKRISKEPARFGQGAIEGITAPEACNNSAAQVAFIPTLSLGVPGDAVMPIMLAAMMIHGITPGPQFISAQPELFWGLMASFWIGNLLLLVLNIPLIGVWVRVVTIPRHILNPAILFLICVGVFSVNGRVFDVFVTALFGLAGYLMALYRYPAAPLLLGFILAPLIEENFRRALLISRGDFAVFIERPMSATLLAVTALLLLFSLWRMARPAIARWRAAIS